MARNRKNGRFSRQTTRRRSRPKTNLTNIAVSLAVANGLTQGMFNTSVVEFMTGRVDGKYNPGGDGGSVITLPELLGAKGRDFGGTYGGYATGFLDAVSKNAKSNMGQLAFTLIAVPVLAKVATKVLRKPVLNPANKLIKMTGLDVKV